ncbi:hypothetical protein Moror_17827 [Moniliophthora roreri MCA 2997]|uniref:Uncharacterized protein n=1 Tax=Moniliophthora roreri (strain MCA 2997) TaxID=1381753 RepID=V2XU19_MONRO|nr:hypothetical protein Moror_17827 [Moniliophthora roreri MCA 2997]
MDGSKSTLLSSEGEPQTPISRRCSISSEDTVFGTTITPYPEISEVQYSIAIMQGGIEALEETLEKLQQNTLRDGMFGDNDGVVKQLSEIRSKLRSQGEAQRNGIDEINLILKDMLGTKVIEQIQSQVEEEVEAEVDRVVERQVQACLEEHLPKQLQKEVNERKAELEQVRRDLHNSESRRANALLRERNTNEAINTILRTDGSVSSHFPKTLKDLFELNAAECKATLEDYGVETSSQKDSNLNRLMQFLNVQYQMVRTGSGKETQRRAATM